MMLFLCLGLCYNNMKYHWLNKKVMKMNEKRKPKPRQDSEEFSEGILEGRNAVMEALRAGRTIDKLYLASGETDHGLTRIASLAKQAGIVVTQVDRRKLDQMSITHAHQGVIAMVAAHSYVTVEQILQIAKDRGEPPLIVLCDELSDPHNLGAILRTTECVGAHGLVIPKRRSAGLTATVAKASAGAIEYLPVAKVSNMTQTIAQLKQAGIWIYGTAANGAKPLYETDLTGPAAIVIGSEGDGMSRLVAEQCDFLVSIPMKGHIDSLNASAAAAVLLYEALRQRG